MIALQDRLDVPVLAPAARRRASAASACRRPPTSPRRSPLPPPHPARPRSRPSAPRCGSARVDPAAPGHRRDHLRRLAGRNTARARQAIAALWDLVGRPTVNLAARDASLALAAKVFRTGLLESADGADIGWSIVPLPTLHGELPARALDAAGVEVVTGVHGAVASARAGTA